MFNSNYNYIAANSEHSPFKPVLDVQEHLWLRKQSENRRIKFDRQRSAQQNRFFQKEFDFKLIKIQREIRSIRSLIHFFPKLKQPNVSTQILQKRVSDFENTINAQPRPNSSKIVKQIINCKYFNDAILIKEYVF